MDMGRFLIETHLRTGRPIKELARSHEVSASWLFKLLAATASKDQRDWSLAPGDRIVAHPNRRRSTRTRSSPCTRRWPTTARCRRGHGPVPPGPAPRSAPVDLDVFRVLKARGFVALHHRSARRARSRGSWPTCPTRPGRPT